MPRGTPAKNTATAPARFSRCTMSAIMDTEQGWPPASMAPIPTRVATRAA